jgi:hypothetical protein
MNTIKHALVKFARPQSGARLYAHTAAFLKASGLQSGGAIAEAIATEVLGTTAVKYHASMGTLEHTTDGLVLTDFGKDFFAARHDVSPALEAAYLEVLVEGKANPAVVKAQSSVVRIG